MDLSTILPLLATSGKNQNLDPQKMALLQSLSKGDKLDPASMMGMLGGSDPSMQNKMQLVNTLSMMQKKHQGENSNQKSPQGLKPVKTFCPEVILGRMVKFFDE